jgi:hypothetical protein
MKKNIKKLQLNKKTINILGNGNNRYLGGGMNAVSKAPVTCGLICLPTMNSCPPPLPLTTECL